MKVKRANILLADVSHYKITIKMKDLVWYREPFSPLSKARLSVFSTNIDLKFSNSNDPFPRQVSYWLPSQQSLEQFLSHPLKIQIMNADEIIGYSTWNPRLFSEKVMIGPVVSVDLICGRSIKLGDISIEVKMERLKDNQYNLKQLENYLNHLQINNPCKLRSIYYQLAK